MNHEDHVALLRMGVPGPGGRWADLGSGSGAFTLALAELLGPESEIYSVDKNRAALQSQVAAMQAHFPATHVHYLNADFTCRLALPPLDGVIMANSLHFQRDQEAVIQLVRSYLRPSGRLIIVEYNIKQGTWWVPHPIPYSSWEVMARRNGFAETQLLARRPSRSFGEIYAAMSH